ncbi:TPA: hypothetical protein ACH3X1_001504 [Trebouxia sp. C0004]
MCRTSKPAREIQAILQREEDLQNMQELEIAEAVIQEAQKTEAIDDCDVRSAPSLELCSTTEMLEVFSDFYDGDKQDMRGQYVDNTRIDSSVPALTSQAVLSRWSFPTWTLVLS